MSLDNISYSGGGKGIRANNEFSSKVQIATGY